MSGDDFGGGHDNRLDHAFPIKHEGREQSLVLVTVPIFYLMSHS